MTPEEEARISQTVVCVCAAGHPLVTYYGRRDQPELPCPKCGQVQQRPSVKEKEST
jgi:hypothetical protein